MIFDTVVALEEGVINLQLPLDSRYSFGYFYLCNALRSFLFGCSLGRSVCGFVSPDARVGWHPSQLDSRPTISSEFVYELYRVNYDERT